TAMTGTAGLEKATVIIPCYNSEGTIERAVRSALDQTLPVQVIVVDDCSRDRSFEIVQAMAASEPRLTSVRQAKNGGPSAARNTALRLVTTPWVAGLDSDDYLLPGRMKRLVDHAEAQSVDFVADDLIRLNPGERPEEGYRVWRDEQFGIVELPAPEFVRQNITKYAGYRREIGYLKPLMRMDFLRQKGLFYNEGMRLSEDYEFYVRSHIEGARWQIIDPCGYIAVNRQGSLSNAVAAVALKRIRDADTALMQTPGLSADVRRAIGDHREYVTTDLAWMNLIDAVKARRPAAALATFGYSPAVSAALFMRLAKHFLRIPLYPEDAEAGREPIGASGVAGLT
ncbi:glycosyltransferase family 2 protein, partial [Hyphomonas sp.]|uniref:glycosyltransferase family 2 protein n=1 Tax=Hyphomonas sp. TaxID=87 RepID=UPI0039195AAC